MHTHQKLKLINLYLKNMKKFKCLAASLLLFTAITNAKPVTPATAATVAGNYYGQLYNTDAQTLTLTYTEYDANGQPVYYVYNVGTENGFVIVSAEDAGSPIIGSSNTGHYVIPTAANNVGYWMNRRKKEIIAMRAANLQATTEVTAEWNGYINNTKNTHQAMSSVSPLLGINNTAITWDQSPYYNADCPGGSVTGCVATAMAQIMKYWSYPSVGLGQWCYYDDQAHGYSENYGQLCATFDTSNYVWSEMPYKVTSPNAQVAKLMYDCGVSVDMDYTPTGSGAFVLSYHNSPSAQTSYVTYFNYNPSTIQGALEARYSASAWISLLENELNNKRPVQYQGTDSVYGGHSWVCDGYNNSNQLHMNWGWNGSDDGYYNATDLAPSNSGYNFSDEDVGALIGIEPPAGVLSVDQVAAANPSVKLYPNPSNGLFHVDLENVTGNPQIIVYNVLGQPVYSAKLTSIQNNLNLGNQPKGVYIYRVINENGNPISTGRLVIE